MIRLRTSSSKLRPYLLALLTLPALLLSASPTEAAVISNVSGNTRPFDPGFGTSTGVDGTVNFAVFNRTGGTAADPWGTGSPVALATAFQPGVTEAFGGTAAAPSPGLDVNAQFLYIFQTVNDGTNQNVLSQNSVGVTGLPLSTSVVTSWGRFLRLGFSDAQGPIVGTQGGNTFLGSVAAPFGDRSPAQGGATPVTIVQASVGVLDEPDTVTLGPTSLRALFSAAAPSLNPNTATSLWGYTSNVAPAFAASTGIIDGGTTADGTVPAPTVVPEPATVLSLLAGLPVMGVYWLRRRRTQPA